VLSAGAPRDEGSGGDGVEARMIKIRMVMQEVRAWEATLGSAAVYATLIVTFLGQIARVDGSSMQPTLEDNDRLVVNKLAYRRDGKIFVNDVAMPESFLSDEYRSHDSWGPTIVPEGYFWVMGDHRNNSYDSRMFHEVPAKYILGKVAVRWWPLPKVRIF
jgi:signal peptidase I